MRLHYDGTDAVSPIWSIMHGHEGARFAPARPWIRTGLTDPGRKRRFCRRAAGGFGPSGSSAMDSASARVIIVAGHESGRALAQVLSRMGLSGVRIVPSAHDARLLCESNHADACLVMLPRALPDEMPRWSADSEAPGRGAGVPSLLIAEVVTPHLARFARNFGYFAAIPA